MSDFRNSLPATPPVRRGLSAILAGAALFAVVPACAVQATPAHHHRASSLAGQLHGETVDQRIHTLHTDLRITPAQEPAWNDVAAVMRRNDTTMKNMVLERRQNVAQDVSAADDLVVYQKFNQAHVDGLKDLIASF